MGIEVEAATDPLTAIDEAMRMAKMMSLSVLELCPMQKPFSPMIHSYFSISVMTARASLPEALVEIDRGDYSPIAVTTMTEYERKLETSIIFPSERPNSNLSDTISKLSCNNYIAQKQKNTLM